MLSKTEDFPELCSQQQIPKTKKEKCKKFDKQKDNMWKKKSLSSLCASVRQFQRELTHTLYNEGAP